MAAASARTRTRPGCWVSCSRFRTPPACSRRTPTTRAAAGSRSMHREAGTRRCWYDGRQGWWCAPSTRSGHDLRGEVDARGRLKRLAKDGAVLEEYVYDDPARNALGRLARGALQGRRAGVRLRRGRAAVPTYVSLRRPRRTRRRSPTVTTALGREISVTHTDGTSFSARADGERLGARRARTCSLRSTTIRAGCRCGLQYANGVVTANRRTRRDPAGSRTQQTTGPGGVLEDVTLPLRRDGMPARGRGRRARRARQAHLCLRSALPAQRVCGRWRAAPTRVREYGYANFMNLARYDEADVDAALRRRRPSGPAQPA